MHDTRHTFFSELPQPYHNHTSHTSHNPGNMLLPGRRPKVSSAGRVNMHDPNPEPLSVELPTLFQNHTTPFFKNVWHTPATTRGGVWS
jgi:hypothetical protein